MAEPRDTYHGVLMILHHFITSSQTTSTRVLDARAAQAERGGRAASRIGRGADDLRENHFPAGRVRRLSQRHHYGDHQLVTGPAKPDLTQN